MKKFSVGFIVLRKARVYKSKQLTKGYVRFQITLINIDYGIEDYTTNTKYVTRNMRVFKEFFGSTSFTVQYTQTRVSANVQNPRSGAHTTHNFLE